MTMPCFGAQVVRCLLINPFPESALNEEAAAADGNMQYLMNVTWKNVGINVDSSGGTSLT